MARDNRATGRGAAPNRAGRPTGSYGSYGPSGYGYGAAGGGGAYGRSPYGAQQQSNVPAQVTKEKAPEKNLKGKDKKIAKKAKKFDETDLRCYPMTIRAWIGTFILLAIPLVGGICAICWFFGVGNKSRTAWVRSYVVIVLLIVLLLGILVGSVIGVLTSKAKDVEVVFEEQSYGTLGDYGMKGTLYYVACGLVDALGPEVVSQLIGKIAGGNGEDGDEAISGEDGVMMIKMMLAQKILGIGEDEDAPENAPIEGEGGSTGGDVE